MEISQIKEEVTIAVNKWSELAERQQRPLRLTNGAVEALTQMIVNIEKDPSPYWVDIDYDSVQRFSISIIPNILVDMSHWHGRYHWQKQEVSSWEIWHNISNALDKWCPVPKDI